MTTFRLQLQLFTVAELVGPVIFQNLKLSYGYVSRPPFQLPAFRLPTSRPCSAFPAVLWGI